jgi:iron complex outermembrane receptor protein
VPTHSVAQIRRAGRSVVVFLALGYPCWAQAPIKVGRSHDEDLTQVSIESLMNMEVTTVSKKEQKLSQVAAAIFVITQEEIRRSEATSIPDLLRIVPGLDVAQINASMWAITARGFNLQFANKLLVLIDGRAVYTKLFGGVYWDTQDVPLEDIERIEVIRGPGGTVWDANAVNGVINVITKKAADLPNPVHRSYGKARLAHTGEHKRKRGFNGGRVAQFCGRRRND